MKRGILEIIVFFALFPLIVDTGFALEPQLPLIRGKKAVATVNGEPITLEDLNQALGMLHAEGGGEGKAGKIDYSETLKRLVNTRLVLLEARNIGLEELPAVKEEVDRYARRTLEELLLQQRMMNIRVDEGEVEEAYEKLQKEYRFQSLLFEKEEDAREAEEEIKSGKEFAEMVKRVEAEGTAKISRGGEYVKAEELLPEIKKAVSLIDVGAVSPIVRVKKGFVLLKLEEIRFPEDSGARERAKEIVLNIKKGDALESYIEDLKNKYVTLRQEVLDAVDYEAKEPGLQALLKDKRILAEVEGENPVTVGELSEAIRKKHFHGIETAVRGKKINPKKGEFLETILRRRVIRKEALRQGIDKTETYRNMVREHENKIIFGVFMQKVILPEIQLEEKDLKTFYEKNLTEFSAPGMIRLRSLIFSEKNFAEDALGKLKSGVDFTWLAVNAEGQVDKTAQRLLPFEGTLRVIDELPEDVREVLSGAVSGDLLLYENPEGQVYVLSVQEVIRPRPQPYEAVRGEIKRKLVNEKMNQAVDAYTAELRKSYPVKIYLKNLKS